MVVAVVCDCGKWLFRKGITAEEQANDGYRVRNSWDSLLTGLGLLTPEDGLFPHSPRVHPCLRHTSGALEVHSGKAG